MIVPEPTPQPASQSIDPAFAALLCCPICPSRPVLRLGDEILTCSQCGRVFPIIDGLPDLRPESAEAPAGNGDDRAADSTV